jgi:hypothetical protein
MSNPKSIVEQVELSINNLAAEITAQRFILQMFVVHLVEAFPAFSEEVLHNLKSETMSGLERQTIDPQEDIEGQTRSKAFSIAHGERFFRTLEVALSESRKKAGLSGRN